MIFPLGFLQTYPELDDSHFSINFPFGVKILYCMPNPENAETFVIVRIPVVRILDRIAAVIMDVFMIIVYYRFQRM